MQIKMLKPNSFEIKSKDSVVLADGQSVEINKVKLLGPGEYEIGGIEVFGFDQSIYILIVDGVIVGYLADINKSVDEKEIEEFGNVDVLIVPNGSSPEMDIKKIAELAKSIDPKIVLSSNNDNTKAFCDAFGKCEDPVETYKSTKQQLMSMEGLTAIQLKG